MYKKIMVPLDGSELAECVLPHVEGFIKGFQVRSITFVRVVEPAPTRFDDTASLSSASRDKIMETTRRIEEKRKSAAAEYLEGVVSRLKREGVEFETEVLIGRVADSLADYTETKGVDLILIATHGRSGISRWVRGSIADRVLRFSRVPVLMVPADHKMSRNKL
ncbi:MAG: universal stress protein [Deltaproteobacteria bacterium]|nr:MAG: universal stress protein [Deltaproteobacteria bacterium]